MKREEKKFQENNKVSEILTHDNKQHNSNTKRQFIKTVLLIPMLGGMSYFSPVANAMYGDRFYVPDAIFDQLLDIYGSQVYDIVTTDKIILRAPDIAENGAVVGISITGEKEFISSMAIFADKNKIPLINTCTLHDGSDLNVSLRIKLDSTSDVYMIAQTEDGLVGVKKNIKVTLGCGGGI